MIIFDSVKKAKVELEPIVAGKVSIYVCGQRFMMMHI